MNLFTAQINNVGDIVNLCMTWLPIHAWGHAATQGNLESVGEITSFAVMRERLYELIKSKKDHIEPFNRSV